MRELGVFGLLALAQSISFGMATPVPFPSGETAPGSILRRMIGEPAPPRVRPTCDNAPDVIAGTYFGSKANPRSSHDRPMDGLVHRAEDDSSRWYHPPHVGKPPPHHNPHIPASHFPSGDDHLLPRHEEAADASFWNNPPSSDNTQLNPLAPNHPRPDHPRPNSPPPNSHSLNPRATPPFQPSARWCAFATKTYINIIPFSPPPSSPSLPGIPALLHQTWTNITEHIRASTDGIIPSGVYDGALPGNGADRTLRFHAGNAGTQQLTWGVLGAAVTAVADWMGPGGERGMGGVGFQIWDGAVEVGAGWVG